MIPELVLNIIGLLLKSFFLHIMPMLIYRFGLVREPLEPRKARKVAILDAIVVFAINFLIGLFFTKTTPSAPAHFVCALIVYRILRSGYREESASQQR